MSSILGVSSVSSAVNPYLTGLSTAMQANFGQTIKDFQSISAALQSGSLTTAQTALASLQKDFQASMQSGATQPSGTTAGSQLFGTNTQANTDFQTLTNSLKSGDLTGAQKAFTSLQTDLKAGLTGGSAATGTNGSTFSNTLSSILSGAGITF
ncbi:MAG TPA: hypothetical protein VH251_02655 [Verrucomicrobiae bacterium]|jgi:hypothetical protein|nr:hypothetical protein [Verrucomicrobiae bacterium]